MDAGSASLALIATVPETARLHAESLVHAEAPFYPGEGCA